MLLTPCPGCSLHCLNDNEGPFALKSVGGKLIHRSCLSILPSYRCLNLYQMTSHIDCSQLFINLKLSPFILCSYFRFLLGFSEMYIPEQFFVMETPSFEQSDDSPTHIPLDPIHTPSPAFALTSGTQFHIVGTVHEEDLSTSQLNCAWVQTLDDYILESGVFSVLPNGFSLQGCHRIDLYNLCVKLSSTRICCKFFFTIAALSFLSKLDECIFGQTAIKDASIPPYLVRAQDLTKETAQTTPSRFIPLIDEIFPSFLKTMGLFTGFDELLRLSRFTMLQTSFHAVDWALSFDTFQQSIYPRLLVSNASTFFQFRLKLWFDELPVMYRLCQRFPGLYADNSLCPNCGIFMETLEHLFICSPSSLDVSDSNPEPLQHKDITVELIQRFIVKLATKISYSPECKRTYEELLSALRNLDSIGLPSLLSDSGDSSFSASWFL
ncbi:hypothetical protein RhiirA4_481346 [Rhizophagus irregularis]|uniref:Uncharacterized protein n=1 Tax=Rhizophagus irregularis TaxID=588596 RepID=A0A2I1HJG1_9GLOM|nr:hypothetical protein RhiirA4_481346 [Rhizophagus irregularis]